MTEHQTQKLICPKCGVDGHAMWLDNRRRLSSLKLFSRGFKAIEGDHMVDVKFVCQACNEIAAPMTSASGGDRRPNLS